VEQVVHRHRQRQQGHEILGGLAVDHSRRECRVFDR
jgi:hypothetical protein